MGHPPLVASVLETLAAQVERQTQDLLYQGHQWQEAQEKLEGCAQAVKDGEFGAANQLLYEAVLRVTDDTVDLDALRKAMQTTANAVFCLHEYGKTEEEA